MYNNPINYIDVTGFDPWFIDGWSDDYGILQDGNTCAVASIAVSLSILRGYKYTQKDVQGLFLHTYNHYVNLPNYEDGNITFVEKNIAIGVNPREQVFKINQMFPNEIKASYQKGTRADLIDNLNNNLLTLITIALPAWDFGHVVTVIGYDPETDELQFYNTAYKEIQPEKIFLEHYGEPLGINTLDELWSQSNLFVSRNSMVTFETFQVTIPIIGSGSGGFRTIINLR